jgi:alkylation response protein AidB-like acyl-CoA dehydrogenase
MLNDFGAELHTPEQALVQRCREFADQVIAPAYRRYDEENRFPDEVHEAARRWDLMDLTFPRDLGGKGLSHRGAMLCVESLAAVCAPIAITLGYNRGTLHPVMIAGTADQQRVLIRDLLARRGFASLCITEEDRSGSVLVAPGTSAQHRAGRWILTGKKCMVGNGTVATIFIVMAEAIVDGERRGPTLFVVPRGAGVTVGPNSNKLGFRALPTPTVSFDNVEIGDEAVIGQVGGANAVMVPALEVMRVDSGAAILGIVIGAFRDAVPWLRQRRVSGDEPLIAKSHVQLRLGELYGQLEAARAVLWRAATLLDEGRSSALESSVAKLLCSELALRATGEISQLFGWRGIDANFPIQKRFRDAQETSIFEGTSDIQRLALCRSLVSRLRV